MEVLERCENYGATISRAIQGRFLDDIGRKTPIEVLVKQHLLLGKVAREPEGTPLRDSFFELSPFGKYVRRKGDRD